MEFVIVLAVLAIVVFVVTAPLRRGDHSGQLERKDVDAASEAAALEAARESKYREIRDAQLDHHTGKLSDADFDAINQALRSEAIEILNALDRAGVDGEAGGENAGVDRHAGLGEGDADRLRARPPSAGE